MSVTFGLSGLPNDVDDRTQGAAFLNGYDRSVDVLGPEFTTLWTSDHFQFGDIPVLEGWTRLSFLAARYEHLHVGSLVLGQGYRNPALLAKMAATLQFLTQGRLVLGIGAGWNEEEYRSYGYGYPSRKDRVDQLEEVLTILQLMWQGGPATFQGNHYSIIDAYCRPVPSTPIPIMIGSGGKRVVRIAAERADGGTWTRRPTCSIRPMQYWSSVSNSWVVPSTRSRSVSRLMSTFPTTPMRSSVSCRRGSPTTTSIRSFTGPRPKMPSRASGRSSTRVSPTSRSRPKICAASRSSQPRSHRPSPADPTVGCSRSAATAKDRESEEVHTLRS